MNVKNIEDEEGWTTVSNGRGKKKGKNNNSNVQPTMMLAESQKVPNKPQNEGTERNESWPIQGPIKSRWLLK